MDYYLPYGYQYDLSSRWKSQWTCLVSRNSSRPSMPSSRAPPEYFIPPNVPALTSSKQVLIFFRSSDSLGRWLKLSGILRLAQNDRILTLEILRFCMNLSQQENT